MCIALLFLPSIHLLYLRIYWKRCAVVFECTQIPYNDERAPILPPDDQGCVQLGEKVRVLHTNIDEAREAYKIGINLVGSRKKQRKYLYGSRYRNFFHGSFKIIDVRDYGGVVNLNILIEKGETSILKIRDLSMEKELMTSVKKFNDTMKRVSIARSHSGDEGKMFAFGFRNLKEGDYKSMKCTKMDVRSYCVDVRNTLDNYFKLEIDEIIDADLKQGVIPSDTMGGKNGISAYSLVSEDLVNAPHFDLDTSVGISVFNEKHPGSSTNWNFVLPNTMLVDGNNNEAIVIKLFDGCTLSWDGRKIFHCTSMKDIGEGNHVYGNYWGGKNYK